MSKEFCGGTYVENTKDIKEFVIGSVESIGSGIYRFVGYTNELIKQYDQYLGNLIEVIDQLNKKVQTIDPNFMPPVKPTVTGSYQDVLNYRNYIKTYQDIIKNLENHGTTKSCKYLKRC